MKRFAFVTAFCITLAACGYGHAFAGELKLISDTGNLLRGTVYKQSGIDREGVITIRTKWNLPGTAPVFRYDFDIINGKVADNYHNFLIGDIAEMVFPPSSDGDQYINIRLRNGVIHKLQLTSEKRAVIGSVSLWITNVSVITDGYGENIIPIGEINRIVFDTPQAGTERSMSDLVDDFSKALETGVRDDLIDENLAVVLEKLQKRMKARLLYEEKGI